VPSTCPPDQPHPVFFNTTLSKEIRLEHHAAAGTAVTRRPVERVQQLQGPGWATEGLRKCSTRQTPGGQVVFAAGQTPWCPLAPALVSPSRAARAPPGAWGSARAPSCCSARPCRWPAPGWPASWTYWRSSLRRAPSEMFAVRCMCCTASKLSFNSASVASIFSQLSHSSQPAVV